MWFDESVLVDIQKRAAHVSVRLSSQWPASALELRTRERVTQDEWNHVAVVSDGTGKASGLKLYINGIAAETDILKDQLVRLHRERLPNCRSASKSPNAKPFSGGLDDLRFYARTLAAADVKAHSARLPDSVIAIRCWRATLQSR